MALLRVEYASKALEMNTSFQVFLPDEGDLAELLDDANGRIAQVLGG